MNKFWRALGYMPPILVVGGLGYFVYFSLYVYKPSDHLACAKSVVAQQADIAVHAVRQWAGKEGQQYQGCPETGQ